MSDPHCATCICGKRAPVQGDGHGRRATRGPGTIAWAEHMEAWSVYSQRGHGGQSAENIAGRGGFGFDELAMLLGHAPRTWVPW